MNCKYIGQSRTHLSPYCIYHLSDSDSDSSNLYVSKTIYSNKVYRNTDILMSCPRRTRGRGEAWEDKGEG